MTGPDTMYRVPEASLQVSIVGTQKQWPSAASRSRKRRSSSVLVSRAVPCRSTPGSVVFSGGSKRFGGCKGIADAVTEQGRSGCPQTCLTRSTHLESEGCPRVHSGVSGFILGRLPALPRCGLKPIGTGDEEKEVCV